MAIVTLTTDWERQDYYVAALKGEILKREPSVAIVDITHTIPPFLLQGAAYIVKSSFGHFPNNTIHIIGVDCEPSATSPIVAVKYRNQYFIGADNGILGMICDYEPDLAVKISYTDTADGFSALTPFADTAAALAEGKSLESLGETIGNVKFVPALMPVLDKMYIIGNIIYIDSFENAITNITQREFENVRKDRKFEILVQSNRYRIRAISPNYRSVEDGEFVAIFNSSGHLEIAQNKGKIASLLNLDLGSTIRINFVNQ